MRKNLLQRRIFLAGLTGVVALPLLWPYVTRAAPGAAADANSAPYQKTDEEWKMTLTPEQYHVLREEGTERAFTSPLNEEKRAGTFVCAGCGTPLFTSDTKYNSGTGWPSFYQALPGAVATKTDYKIGQARTEYHCAHCGGHQGHVFEDGPDPTGLRYCNNGIALKFVPESDNKEEK
jgi:peptide-methionine (R)-S-oxide reductase